ncbi:hypothetical protein Pmani_022247 [Petrolisthes manimaculis]|uniref:Uncharacterized protein n=1 Tax=Petrolisthes manimaculis TaxID=1843537 RepID=A0AAE1PC42_9EUCA|nr:hypothetical protein Pmani_022247 [Petrolisthes manimaculis]
MEHDYIQSCQSAGRGDGGGSPDKAKPRLEKLDKCQRCSSLAVTNAARHGFQKALLSLAWASGDGGRNGGTGERNVVWCWGLGSTPDYTVLDSADGVGA